MQRMPMMPVHEAVNKSVQAIGQTQKITTLKIGASTGYILAEPVLSGLDLPPYTKATVDGYAVKAENIAGASQEHPAVLEVVGESTMGVVTPTVLKSGQAQYVPTGGMVPEGADTMVMIEDTDLGKYEVEVYAQVEFGQNMIRRGEDLKTGQVGVKAGVCITSRHIGLFAAMGVESVKVIEKPTVAILSTGDELIELGAQPSGGQIFDINTHSLKALCQSYGLEVVHTGIVHDDFEALCDQVGSASEKADILLISGGSSVGEKDMTADAVSLIPGAEVIVHGLAFKPGKPTLIAKHKKGLVLGLPGHPVSALMVMDTIGRRILDEVWDTKIPMRHRVRGKLTASVTPAPGRDSCQMVRVEASESGIRVIPHYGKSGMISWIGHSDGYIVAEHKDGVLMPETEVTVFLWDNNSEIVGIDWV